MQGKFIERQNRGNLIFLKTADGKSATASYKYTGSFFNQKKLYVGFFSNGNIKMNIKNFIIPAIACFCCSSFFISCEEKGLMVNDNDVSYIIFAKDMTKDTTTVSFKVYNEGEVPEIPLEVSVYGKVQDKDLKFSVSVDEDRTTLPANLYELPTECLIEKGQLTGSVCIKLKNSEILSTNTLILALKIDEKEEVREGARQYSRAIVTVTDRLFKPSWWSVADTGGADTPLNSVEEYYLGIYLEDKYKMFLDELKKDDMVFDGKNKQVLRKYALKLKNTLKDINAERAAQGLGPLVDEKTQLEITVPVAG